MAQCAQRILADLRGGRRLDVAGAAFLAAAVKLDPILATAEALTLSGHGNAVGWSRKVFIPLTRLCRNRCGYCTFAESPRPGTSAYLGPDEVLALARAGAEAGCREALLTLGERPELRHPAAREALATLGFDSTVDYVAAMAQRIFDETGLLPHLNPGTLSAEELARLRPYAASMGLMLESTATRLSERGGPHWQCPDKHPDVRLATLRAAGEQAIAMTSGILVGIGETRLERIEALFALRELNDRYGHIQELIVQNFRAKPRTAMALASEPDLAEHQWTVAMARLIFGPTMSIQAPPNLRPGELAPLIRAGINDWGGISPVTPDHVNPEAAWPHIATLRQETETAGRELVERLALVPAFARDAARWTAPGVARAILHSTDASGFARDDAWHAGSGAPLPPEAGLSARRAARAASGDLLRLIDEASAGGELFEDGITALFEARGADYLAVVEAADRLRAATVGEGVSFVANCNINYTNICKHRCGFCAFAKGRSAESLRGPAYVLSADEVGQRALEAHRRGATEVCLQGGIHPAYTGESYLDIVAAVRGAVPDMHIHAFSPLEIRHGAATLGLSPAAFLRRLRDAGLGSLPGTAAEVLDDEVRAKLCPDKLGSEEWLAIVRAAHEVGVPTTSTIMFGHVDTTRHWARHLLQLRQLQRDTGGITEFVPLPFVHMESPLWHKGRSRSGPTAREAVLMHAVARLALHPLIPNIQTSWVKMGPAGAGLCLQAGANDLGGTLMYESITRAAGGLNGQEMDGTGMNRIATSIGRPLWRRNTVYGRASSRENALPPACTETAACIG
ncbi:5-amino-6-(D-ribitylamino)uracil--L-tyrosine 4-hydroxyphenyl transferase CofH [Aromatoleum toluclasticum]|uniref:5-amino-6-(D-ribitylamino)uracil--L-tyrosine 4-hydroxyphenyl transferase CofH n=1 Tax=Aromatoleum toluclasticum TaxID=92003 RepID=UPI001D183865|nr:5-amino-6-(D-ribitylamino)uracil--L-tyrosine 4-hydroxyphenyl transferase CofH [Aromatoleum toluclasticum]MCC4117534.1 5-amino-6-(D-ribitylamino)uracil--L-tyrosine 4-hydroxyphenyl transferase CofH [Aromatoleum toluclasticum]